MPKFERTVSIDAIQFTGNNVKTVQNFVGSRNLDLKGNYSFPLFDHAENWLEEGRYDESTPAVVNINGMWLPVAANSWLVKNDAGEVSVYTEEQFNTEFSEYIEDNNKNSGKK